MARKIINKEKKVTNSKYIEQVIPLGNGWAVKNNQSQKFTIITDNQKEAITIAREKAKAKGGELIVHAKNGTIREKKNYSTLPKNS